MVLNHLDLQVSDVEASVRTFEQLFGLTMLSNRQSPALAIMSDGAGFTLVLQRQATPKYPEGFHLGFILADVAAVEAAHRRLVAVAGAHGVEVGDVGTNGRGTQVYCRLPDGIVVEVSCRKVKTPHGGAEGTLPDQ